MPEGEEKVGLNIQINNSFAKFLNLMKKTRTYRFTKLRI